MRAASKRVFGLLVCVAATVAVVFLSPSGPEFVPYTPVLWDGNAYVERPDLLTEEHQRCMLTLLSQSGNARIGDDGGLLIVGSLSRDPDLLSNYTRKAEDLRVERATADAPRP